MRVKIFKIIIIVCQILKTFTDEILNYKDRNFYHFLFQECFKNIIMDCSNTKNMFDQFKKFENSVRIHIYVNLSSLLYINNVLNFVSRIYPNCIIRNYCYLVFLTDDS